MGACVSTGGDHLIEAPDGDRKQFYERFLEDEVIGQGEFGVVKKVYEFAKPEAALACKTLRKVVVFKDDVLYPPPPPTVLLGELEMLRAVRVPPSGDDNFCVQLHSVYESPKEMCLVTELCHGGDMIQYVSQQKEDLRTEDISRIAYQVLTAIDHCASHKIIHRDIKPQNCLFQSIDPQSPLRLIDFGAGALDNELMASLRSAGDIATKSGRHTTFVGTPFYNSPEMFAHNYTQKTDVFSIGVCLYVLAAGYPADQLQKAFNILQNLSTENRDLKKLPNLPQNLPASFYNMLEDLLVYQPRHRKTAKEMLSHSFVTFHQDLLTADDDEQEVEEMTNATSLATGGGSKRPSILLRRQSVSLVGSVDRHYQMLSYKAFERSLTTFLATLLNNSDLILLVNILRYAQRGEDDQLNTSNETLPTIASNGSVSSSSDITTEANAGPEKLGIIRVSRLLDIVEDDLCQPKIVDRIYDLPNATDYTKFAYHTSLIMDLVKASKKLVMTPQQQRRLRRSLSRSSSSRSLVRGGSMRDLSSGSNHSQSFRRRSSFRKGMQDGSTGSGSFHKVERAKKPRAQSVMIRGL